MGLIGLIQGKVPSLDSRPSLVPGQPLPPPIKLSHQTEDDGVDIVQEFVYHRGLDGTLRKVKVVTDESGHRSQDRSGVRPGHNVPQREDPDTSSDEDCDMTPKPGFRLRWKRDPTGTKYNIEEEMTPEPRKVYKYVRDASGRSYKKLVPQEDSGTNLVYKWVIDPDTGHKVQMLVLNSPVEPKLVKTKVQPHSSDFIDHRAASSQNGHKASTGFERGPGFISVPSCTAEEKQGKGSIPDIVKYARDCPVAWTTKAAVL